MTVVFGLVLVYPPIRLAELLLPGWDAPLWLKLVLFGLPFPVRYLAEHWRGAVSRALSALVLTWLGYCFLGLCALLPVELLLLAGVFEAQPLALTATVLVALTGTLGVVNAQRLHVRELPFALPEDLPTDTLSRLRGMRLAQISDLHIGSRQPGLLRRTVTRTNCIEPDAVLITGDLIDWRGITAQELAPLADLSAPVYFCIGNHERYVDLEEICARLATHGVTVLRNAATDVAPLQIIGIDDAEARDKVARELTGLTPLPERLRVLLYHRPDGAEAAAKWGAHLMLTGHTHRGQIVPFNWLVARVFPRLYRDYRVGDMLLYVSPGTGTWGPVMRLGSKCEITLIRLL